MLREDFLESYWQYKLEEAAAYNATPNPEEEPYKNLYKARKIYQEILGDPLLDEAQFLNSPKEEDELSLDQLVNNHPNSSKGVSESESLHMDVVALKAFLNYLLGNNFFDTDENSLATKHYQVFLETLSRLPFTRAVNFFNYVQDSFNKLGLVFLNGDEDDKGMAYLLKSKKLYEKL